MSTMMRPAHEQKPGRIPAPMLGPGFTLDSTDMLIRARHDSAEMAAQIRRSRVRSRRSVLRKALAAIQDRS